MYCQKCGNQVADDFIYCSRCGIQLAGAENPLQANKSRYYPSKLMLGLAGLAAIISMSFALWPFWPFFRNELPSGAENKLAWVGGWKTSWGDSVDYDAEDTVNITFSADGDTITGAYKFYGNDDGEIIGTITATAIGYTLKGMWKENGKGYAASGEVEFLMFSDRNAFIGKYTRSSEANNTRLWKGHKSRF